MTAPKSSSDFTLRDGSPFGPPLIGALLRVPANRVRQHTLARLHEHGFTDLETAHFGVLSYPGPQGLRPSELAARLEISKQALNYLLGQLETRGYVTRTSDPQDMRSKRIALTDRGLATVPVIRGAVAELEVEWGARLGPERFAQLRALLVDLNDLL
jgi:DNA-binding MarR family transcriptional regulator